mmetsp:Transcript_28881/g.70265  ORF Transcript_28881/g.70265 Transcript_28881/m.70265 type:complete len:212 (-) Transcript_28881:610-1245(-)
MSPADESNTVSGTIVLPARSAPVARRVTLISRKLASWHVRCAVSNAASGSSNVSVVRVPLVPLTRSSAPRPNAGSQRASVGDGVGARVGARVGAAVGAGDGGGVHGMPLPAHTPHTSRKHGMCTTAALKFGTRSLGTPPSSSLPMYNTKRSSHAALVTAARPRLVRSVLNERTSNSRPRNVRVVTPDDGRCRSALPRTSTPGGNSAESRGM